MMLGEPGLRNPGARERRGCPRISLDLPIEYQATGCVECVGGIVLNGSETGFLIRSFRRLPPGTRLEITVLFPDGYELSSIGAFGEIVREERGKPGELGHRYGVKMIEIGGEDCWKLKSLLSRPYEFLPREPSRSVPGRKPFAVYVSDR